ncbi:MAG: PKD domain-containing protein [Planctomycetes bacterium]|nr:PKD domain-containing protein [Planctomycetota bacterium]
MGLERRRMARIGAAVLAAAWLGGCAPSSRRSAPARTQGVAAAAGALQDDGSGWLFFVGADDPGKAGDEGLFQMEVAADGQLRPATKVLDEGGAIEPRFVLASDGAARAAWLVEETAGSGRGRLHASRRGSDGAWGAIEALDDGSIAADAFELAGDASGRALLVWESSGSIVASIAEPGLPFAPAVVLLEGIDPLLAATPRVALNRAGRGILACLYQSAVDAQSVVAWSFDPALGITPLGVLNDPSPEAVGALAVAAAVDGSLVVAWCEDVPFAAWSLEVRRVDDGGVLLPIETPGFEPLEPPHLSLHFAESGVLYLAFADRSDVQWIRSTAPGVFESTQSTSVYAYEEFGFAIEPSGRITCVGAALFGSTDITGARYGDGVADSERRSLAPSLSSGALPRGLTLLQGGPLTLAFWIVGETLEVHAWRDPYAEFKTRPLSPVAGEVVQLDATASVARSTGTLLSDYLWDFDGDGLFEEESKAATVDHLFPVGGTFDVSLRVVDEFGDATTITAPIDVFSGDGPPWDLMVNRQGGDGGVSSDVDGDGVREIDCPSDCLASFADGLYVYLAVAPAPGFKFWKWEGLDVASGDGDYGIEGCVVHMIRDRTVTAHFVADPD